MNPGISYDKQHFSSMDIHEDIERASYNDQ